MNALSAFILVCSMNTGVSDCGPDTALEIVRAGDAATAFECALRGQAALAAVAPAPLDGGKYDRFDGGQYAKAVCIAADLAGAVQLDLAQCRLRACKLRRDVVVLDADTILAASAAPPAPAPSQTAGGFPWRPR